MMRDPGPGKISEASLSDDPAADLLTRLSLSSHGNPISPTAPLSQITCANYHDALNTPVTCPHGRCQYCIRECANYAGQST